MFTQVDEKLTTALCCDLETNPFAVLAVVEALTVVAKTQAASIESLEAEVAALKKEPPHHNHVQYQKTRFQTGY